MIELYALFSGTVQGVGFRYTVQDYARTLGISGIARNLPNGKVELIVQGPKEKLLIFLDTIEKDPGIAQIEEVKTQFRPISKPIIGFKIL